MSSLNPTTTPPMLERVGGTLRIDKHKHKKIENENIKI